MLGIGAPAIAVGEVLGANSAGATTVSWSLNGNAGSHPAEQLPRHHRRATVGREDERHRTAAAHERGPVGVNLSSPTAQLHANSTTASAVRGDTSLAKGAGVRGTNTSGDPIGKGVVGSVTNTGYGVYGSAGSGYGVFGTATNTDGAGVGGAGADSGLGVIGTVPNNGDGVRGTAGIGNGIHGTAVDGNGVLGTVSSSSGVGIRGAAPSNGKGVFGSVSDVGAGVYGVAGSGAGVSGNAGSGNGVLGVASVNTGVGVRGNGANGGKGVVGHVPDTGYGVTGQAGSGYGVYGTANDGRPGRRRRQHEQRQHRRGRHRDRRGRDRGERRRHGLRRAGHRARARRARACSGRPRAAESESRAPLRVWDTDSTARSEARGSGCTARVATSRTASRARFDGQVLITGGLARRGSRSPTRWAIRPSRGAR